MTSEHGPAAEERRDTGLRVYRRLSSQQSRGLAEISHDMGGPLGEAVIDFCMGELWERPHLDLKTRSLVLVGALTALGDSRALRAHISGAMAHGATKDELREVFLLMSGYAGFPRATGAAEIGEELFRRADGAREEGSEHE